MLKLCTPLLAVTLLLSTAYAQTEENPHIKLNHNGHLNDAQNAASTATGGQPPLLDHGGPVLPSSKVWAIYWGPSMDFPADLQPAMASLLGGLNKSPYLATVQEYMRGADVSTSYLGAIADGSAPPAKAPRTSDVAAEVCKLFPSPDPTTLYIVFTSNAPNINYCAWHDRATCNGVPIQEISDTVGHKCTHVTETVYRHVIVPAIRGGATVMDAVFGEADDAGDEDDQRSLFELAPH